MNAVAETTFTTPKIPVKNRDEDTDVNPADMKITGASLSKLQLVRLKSREGICGLTIVKCVQADHILCYH
jgi:hypothetical protein